MKRLVSTLFGLALLCLFAEAQAVPSTVAFTGRLSTTNGPVTGNVNIVFTLYDAATGGSSQWTETRNNIAAVNGLVYVDLGAATTLDETVFGNGPLFLEINVAGETLSPRLPIQSVPYAIRSQAANTADTLGTITQGDVLTNGVTSGGGISAMKTGNTLNVALSTCAANQVLKSNGATWSCQADADTNTTYGVTANAGLALSGTNFGLTTCTAGQVLKAGAGGTWACAADADTNTTYSALAGGGITINGSNQIAVDGTVVARKDAAAGNQAFDTNTLFLDYTNNVVGVGQTPAAAGARLQVSGALQATTDVTANGNAYADTFNYNAARTGYYFIPGSAFSPNVEDELWYLGVGYGYIGSGTSAYSIALHAPVNLPQGSTVETFTCYRYDSNAGGDLTGSFSLYESAYASTSNTAIATVSIATTGSSTNVTAVSDTTPSHVVTNNTNGYFIYGVFTTGTNFGGTFRFYGCRITYTYQTVAF